MDSNQITVGHDITVDDYDYCLARTGTADGHQARAVAVHGGSTPPAGFDGRTGSGEPAKRTKSDRLDIQDTATKSGKDSCRTSGGDNGWTNTN